MKAAKAHPAQFRFSAFSNQQKRLMNWWRPVVKASSMDYVIADGSIRSGKTIACICGFLQWSQEMFDGEAFILTGKTMGALKKNVIRPMLQILETWGWPYNYIRSGTDTRLEIGGNTYFLYGANTEASQDALQGLTAAGAYADEAALFPKNFIDQMIGRCSVDGWKVWMNCNPGSPYNHIKTEFIDKADERHVYHLHFTMDDNLTLSEERKDAYRRAWSSGSVFYKRYILGLWVAAEGLIYDMFSEERHVRNIINVSALLVERKSARYVSIDYGTQNATAALLWNKGTDGVWYCIREYYYSGRDRGKQKTDSEYADDLEAWLEETPIRALIVDPSAASFIAELRKRGFKVLPGQNDVEDGIRMVGMMLTQDRIMFSSSCGNTIKEFFSYVWDEKAADRGEDKPIKQHDHAMDAVRYFIYTIVGNKRARVMQA